MKNLKKVYNLTLKDYLEIYQSLGFKAEAIREKDIDCVLLSDTENTPLYIVYINKSSSPLNYDDVKDILIDLELEFQEYKCSNYILISESGYLNKSSFVKDEEVDVYDIQNLNIKLEDSEYIEELIKSSSSNQKHFELNAHNKIAYNNIKRSFSNGEKRVYVRHATGTGKSILVSKYILSECSGNVILLSSSNSILAQFSEHLSSLKESKVKMLTYNKLSQIENDELEHLVNLNPELIVLDEFHRCGAKVWGSAVNNLLNACPNSKVLGTSATPVRYLDNARDMGCEIFNSNIASDISLCEAIVRGIIPMPTYVSAMYEFSDSLNELESRLSASNCSQVEKMKAIKKIEALSNINESFSLIREVFNKHIKNKRNFVVFCKDLEHMQIAKKTVSKWFNAYIEDNVLKCNINTYDLYSMNPDIKDVMSSYLESIKNNVNNNFNILFSIDMANEGVHSKYIDGVILLRPTKSPIIYYQQIGRALHVNPINNPVIFDFVNNSDYIQSQNFITGITDAFNNIDDATHHTLSQTKKINVFLENIYDETKDIVSMLSDIEDVIKVEWDLMYDELVKFKNRRGTTIVRASDNLKLSKWVQKNRYLYTKGELSPERKAKLDKIGFIVSAQDAIWLEHYENLKEHKSIYGHINVSAEYNLQLHRFLKAQRRFYEEGKLSENRKMLLDKLGMIWNLHDYKWETEFLKLVDIYNEIGSLDIIENDTLIVKNSITLKIDESLMQWIKRQRKYYTDGKLSEDRKSRLLSLGLYLNLNEKSWNDNMNALKRFIQVNGHANVTSKDDKKLYIWVKSVRSKRVRGELDDAIIKELDKLGFIWSKKDSLWEGSFANFLTYRNTYGTAVMEKGCLGYDAKIERWIKLQRNLYKEGKLSEYRINKLNEAGFVWDFHEYKWMLLYNELKTFIFSVGETSYKNKLLLKYKGEMPLSSWISTQKKAFKLNTLSEKRLKLLLEIGINFN